MAALYDIVPFIEKVVVQSLRLSYYCKLARSSGNYSSYSNSVIA